MIEIPEKAKDALLEGNTHKNYRMIVHDGELSFTIDNNNLVYESVTITERMSSGDELRFGLCQGSTLEFQYFDLPNIKGKRVECYLDIDYSDGTFTIPMGWFDVQKCSRQASTGIFKATCVNKLKSSWLDRVVIEEVTELVTNGEVDQAQNHATLYWILSQLLQGNSVEYYNVEELDSECVFSAVDSQISIINRNTSEEKVLHICSMDFQCAHEIAQSGVEYYKYTPNKIYADYYKSVMEEFSTMYSDWDVVIREYAQPDKYFTIDEAIHKDVSNETYVVQYSLSRFRGSALIQDRIVSSLLQLTSSEISAESIRTYGALYTLNVPFSFVVNDSSEELPSVEHDAQLLYEQLKSEYGEPISAYLLDVPEISKKIITISDIEAFKNATPRQLQSAVYELNAQFGQLDRVTDLFSGVSLNGKRLHPHNGLHPADGLYPSGSADATQKSMYSQLWTDNVGVQNFRNLIITYKGLDEEDKEEEKVVEYVVNSNGTTDYIMDSNWLLKNLVWTDEQIDEYALNMVSLIKDVTWFPFDMWCSGLPYLETGDEIEVTSKDGTYTTYILERTLNGIQNLQDTFINGNLDIF